MAEFEAKFWGSKEKRGQIKKIAVIVEASARSEVEEKLRMKGWVKINGLKIRATNGKSTD